MSGLFQGLEVGKRALLTHQLSMSTIGHNMANVGTEGYSRQKVRVASAMPLETANFIIGNGVSAQNIYHARDFFLTSQYRRENKSLGEWNYREKTLSQIETFFAEPNDKSLGDVLNQFWNSWMDLSNNPESNAARSAVISHGETMVNTFHSLDRQLQELQSTADTDVVNRVGEINQYAHQIANLNRIIVSEELGDQNANDLRDQRDLLIDQLSQLVDVTTAEKSNGSTAVYISGLAIVENADTFELGTIVDSTGTEIKHDIVWKGTQSIIKVNGGELKGLIDTRDKIVPEVRDKLDELAASLVTQVNAVHQTGSGLDGTGGLNFFNSAFTSAGTIQLETAIVNNPILIAASASGEPGDNVIALQIADLRTENVMSFGTTSITEYYNSMIGSLGVDSQEAQTFKGNYEVLVQQINQSRESVQGVSLDEEATELVKMQHAYNAAARVITVMDEALGTIIQGMGVVGR